MKPVLIFEHIDSSSPGLFQAFLDNHDIPCRILRPNSGDEIPDPDILPACSALCFLGGTESVTQPSAAMLRELALIRAARDSATPVIGHCLGGQLVSKALGGEVKRHHRFEFGWSRLYAENNPLSRRWLSGAPAGLIAMQWHNDIFTLPEGATRILTGDFSENQAFVHGNMLAMQFHVEIDAAMIRRWAIDLADKHPAASDSVQSGKEIVDVLEENFAISSHLARQLYSRWLERLA